MQFMNAIARFLEGKTQIIWDWNGTLLNDFEICVEVVGGLLEESGLKRITPQEHREKFRFPIRDFYSDLGFDYSKRSFETLSVLYIERYRSRLPECDLFPGTRELLSSLRNAGIRQSILSAAQQADLTEQLATLGIADYFDHVYGLSDHFAKSKVERGKELLCSAQIAPETAVLIGDTDHDLEVGKALGVDVLLLGDGHQSFERLSRCHSLVLRSRYEGTIG